MSNTPELLPCPFCGYEAELVNNPQVGTKTLAQCRSCGASLFWKKWQGRTEQAGLRTALAVLEKAAANFHEAATAHISDTTYDADGVLADAEAELSVSALPMARAALQSAADTQPPQSAFSGLIEIIQRELGVQEMVLADPITMQRLKAERIAKCIQAFVFPPQQPHSLRLAVAAVLEADTEFRSNMPKDWEGDPLSDEIDGLRRIFEADPAPQTREAPLPPSKVREE